MPSFCTPESDVEMLNPIQEESERKWNLAKRPSDLISSQSELMVSFYIK